MKIKPQCPQCHNTRKLTKLLNEPDFRWATMGFDGIQPIWIMKFRCPKCNKEFGQVIEHWGPDDAILTEVHS